VDTPFGLRRYLLLSFPEIVAATVAPSRQNLLVRYVPNAAGLPAHETLVKWVRTNKTAGIGLQVERVATIDPTDLPDNQLGDLGLPLDIAEDAAININGIIKHAQRRWPDDFVRVEEGIGRVRMIVATTSSDDTRSAIARELIARTWSARMPSLARNSGSRRIGSSCTRAATTQCPVDMFRRSVTRACMRTARSNQRRCIVI
jgi:hypothetical protein